MRHVTRDWEVGDRENWVVIENMHAIMLHFSLKFYNKKKQHTFEYKSVFKTRRKVVQAEILNRANATFYIHRDFKKIQLEIQWESFEWPNVYILNDVLLYSECLSNKFIYYF